MRVRRWSVGLLFALLLSLVIGPVQAAVIVVDPGQPLVTTLSQDEVRKVATLQNYNQAIPFSSISPDDKSVLIIQARGLSTLTGISFLDISSGSLTPVKYEKNQILPFLVPPVWSNPQTLVYVSLEDFTPVLVAIDRSTGIAKTTPVSLPGFPVAFSPNASRLLVAIQSGPIQSQNSALPDVLVSPFTTEIKRGFDNPEINLGGIANVSSGIGLKPLRVAPEPITLAVLDTTSGKLTPLFGLPADSNLSSVDWSPDSSHLVLVRNTLSMGSTLGLPLGDISTQDTLGNLPRDKNPFFLGNIVDVVDFSSGVKVSQSLLKAVGGSGDVFVGATWSPANTLLTFMARPSRLIGRANPIYLLPESLYLRFYSADGQQTGVLDNEEISLAVLGLGGSFVSQNEVILQGVKGTNQVLYYYNQSTSEFRQLPTNPGTVEYLKISGGQTRQVVFSFSSFTQSPELYRLNWDGSALSQLTSPNNDANRSSAVRADPVSFNLSNGEQRDGYLLQAASASFPANNVPLVFWQEGGPSGAYLNRWAANVENPFLLLPNFGFAVLFVPLEGRFGYGPARYNALADGRNFGQIDIDHGAEIVQQAIDRGYTSAGKVGITGCSYGGYYTSQSITRYPTLYNAAVTQCTLLDLFREFQSGQTPYISYLMGRPSTADPDEYVKDSPIFNATKVKTPTLIFAGQHDFLPHEVSINFHDQLQSQGLATNILLFNNEGHGLGVYQQNQLLAAQAQITWFRQYLGGSSTGPVPAIMPQTRR